MICEYNLSLIHHLKNNLQPGDRVFIKVTPVDISPLAIPSCYNFSVFDLQGFCYDQKNQIKWFDILYVNKKFSLPRR